VWRVGSSFLGPLKPDFMSVTMTSPDLYGPFWVATTLIFVTAGACRGVSADREVKRASAQRLLSFQTCMPQQQKQQASLIELEYSLDHNVAGNGQIAADMCMPRRFHQVLISTAMSCHASCCFCCKNSRTLPYEQIAKINGQHRRMTSYLLLLYRGAVHRAMHSLQWLATMRTLLRTAASRSTQHLPAAATAQTAAAW